MADMLGTNTLIRARKGRIQPHITMLYAGMEDELCAVQGTNILEAAARAPLGLKLKKSPSALEWFQQQLEQQQLQEQQSSAPLLSTPGSLPASGAIQVGYAFHPRRP